jgi:hypothetical protein
LGSSRSRVWRIQGLLAENPSSTQRGRFDNQPNQLTFYTNGLPQNSISLIKGIQNYNNQLIVAMLGDSNGLFSFDSTNQTVNLFSSVAYAYDFVIDKDTDIMYITSNQEPNTTNNSNGAIFYVDSISTISSLPVEPLPYLDYNNTYGIDLTGPITISVLQSTLYLLTTSGNILAINTTIPDFTINNYTPIFNLTNPNTTNLVATSFVIYTNDVSKYVFISTNFGQGINRFDMTTFNPANPIDYSMVYDYDEVTGIYTYNPNNLYAFIAAPDSTTIFTGLTIDGNSIYAVDSTGTLRIYNADTGLPISTAIIESDPNVSNGIYGMTVSNTSLFYANYLSGGISQLSLVEPVTCFLKGTKILTKDGYRMIEELRKGDLIKTLQNGYVPIDMIGYSEIFNSGDEERIKDRLYVCSSSEFPEITEDIVITGCHCVLVDHLKEDQRKKIIELMGGIYITDNKYRLPACVDERTRPYSKKGYFSIYHIALENNDYYMNYGVYANGLLVETTSKRYLKELSKMTLIE